MLFNSSEFFIFLVLTVIIYHLIHRKLKTCFLMIASWYFYSFWNAKFVFLIIFSIIINYSFGLLLQWSTNAKNKEHFLLFNITLNLAILGCFKYYNFFLENISVFLNAINLNTNQYVLNIVLPVGISFYTFQAISYTIDVYNGKIQACKNFFDFGAYLSFFPQLVAGPIERASNIIPQLKRYKKPEFDDFFYGFMLLACGLFKKNVIADNLSKISEYIFGNNYSAPLDSGLALLGVYAFAFQIYCDFSGYTDIARGCGRFFGINLTINFNMPYHSLSVRDFWRKWHISLSNWFRDYLYIPLGGNKRSFLYTLRNIFITMTLCGMWHGASWMFVLWGIYHGTLMIFERLSYNLKFFKNHRLKFFKQMFTFHVVCLGWAIFRSPDWDVFVYWINMLISWQFSSEYYFLWLYVLFFLSPLFVGWMFLYKDNHLLTYDIITIKRSYLYLLFIIVYLGITIFGADQAREFIYFQF